MGTKGKNKVFSGRYRSLRTRIMTSMAALVVAVAVAIGAMGAVASHGEAMDNIEQLHMATGLAYVDALDDYLTMLLLDVTTLAESGAVTSDKLSFEDRQANIVKIREGRDDITSLYTVSAAGVSVNDADTEDIGEDYSDEAFFIKGMECEGGHIDEPYFDKWNETVTMTVSYKLTARDGFSGLVCMDIAYDTVHSLITGSVLGESGYSFLLDEHGVIRSHPDESFVIAEMTYAELFGEGSEAATALGTILDGDSGSSGNIRLAGESVRLYSDTLKTTEWKYVSVIKVGEFLGNYWDHLVSSAIITVVCAVLALIFAFVLSGRIARPISAMRKRMDMLAEGDLHTPLPVTRHDDEIGLLYASMSKSLSSLSGYVQDIAGNLSRMAAGDLRPHRAEGGSAYSDGADGADGAGGAGGAYYGYVGDYMPIKESMENLAAVLRSFFSTTGLAANHVASTSMQLAAASQELTGNVAEQAAAIDRIDRRFEEIKDSLETTATRASETLSKTAATQEELVHSNEDMVQMLAAMHEIETASQSVVKVVKEIDDIAFMSSILSLNAAIEAARAGAHGKGFSVVAGEVRELAGKSADSAHYTEDLIMGAMAAIEKGVSIAEATSKKIDDVCHLLDAVSELIRNIEEAVANQARAANGIYADLSSLNRIVQADTAMSEQTSSVSSELSGRMAMLREELEFFKIKD